MTDGPRSGVRRRTRRHLPLEESVVVVPATASAVEQEARPVVLATVDVEERQSPLPGVPEPVIAAADRYARWYELLTQRGLSHAEARALILEKAEAEGGVVGPDETINLSLWSHRMGIPRPILEALVLAAYRSRMIPVVIAPPVVVVESEPDDEDAWTPPPAGLRNPFAEPPPSSQHLH